MHADTLPTLHRCIRRLNRRLINRRNAEETALCSAHFGSAAFVQAHGQRQFIIFACMQVGEVTDSNDKAALRRQPDPADDAALVTVTAIGERCGREHDRQHLLQQMCRWLNLQRFFEHRIDSTVKHEAAGEGK